MKTLRRAPLPAPFRGSTAQYCKSNECSASLVAMAKETVLISPISFISDIHLGVGNAADEHLKRKLFVQLTDRIRADRGSLCIVGDLFDFWYEYRSVIPRHSHTILTAIERLTSDGLPVVYIAGNHDFAIGDVFACDLGVQVVQNDLYATCDGKRFYIFHGDGLAPNDQGYLLLRRLLRAGWSQTLFRVLHPDIGFFLARRFSRDSRDHTSRKFFGETDGMRIEAQRRIAGGADYVVMGHRHVPIREQLDNGVYVNLGDWITHFSYAVFEHGDISLRYLRNSNSEPTGTVS
jgi:UDP-2,3-diacylglucosamine hydrolase